MQGAPDDFWESLSLKDFRDLTWRRLPASRRTSFSTWRDSRRAEAWLRQICPPPEDDWSVWSAICYEVDRIARERQTEAVLEREAAELWRHRRSDLCWIVGLVPWGIGGWALFSMGDWGIAGAGILAGAPDWIVWGVVILWAILFCLAETIADALLPKRWPAPVTPLQYLAWRERRRP